MTHVVAQRYRLEREIGRGGMGAVWLGHDELLDRQVALKQVGLLPGSDRADVERVRREARVSAMLNHPNVVGVYDLVADEHRHWLVMEYVDSETLADLIRREGALEPDRLAPILAQVAAALAAAHDAGIVHRDVKPSNILIGRDGVVKLGDFGIARTSADPTLTQTGLVTGSPGYMAPEVASGKAAGPASDVWSLGATVYHALVGRPPYDTGENLMGALWKLVHEEPPRTPGAGWLDPLLRATMHRDPSGRWTARQVVAFLESDPEASGATSELPQRGAATSPTVAAAMTAIAPATPAMPASAPPAPPSEPTVVLGVPSRRWPFVVAVALLVAAIALGGWLLDRGGAGDPPASAGSTPTTSAPTEPTARATAEGMEAFVRDYLATVARDPAMAWTQLTRAFQQRSGEYDDYIGWWGGLERATVHAIEADPDDLTVSYDVRYTWAEGQDAGKLKRDRTTLELVFQDGDYLIDYESD